MRTDTKVSLTMQISKITYEMHYKCHMWQVHVFTFITQTGLLLFKCTLTTTSYASIRAIIPFRRSFSWRVVRCAFTLQTKSSTEWIWNTIQNMSRITICYLTILQKYCTIEFYYHVHRKVKVRMIHNVSVVIRKYKMLCFCQEIKLKHVT